MPGELTVTGKVAVGVAGGKVGVNVAGTAVGCASPHADINKTISINMTTAEIFLYNRFITPFPE
jgi:hypothetical protein